MTPPNTLANPADADPWCSSGLQLDDLRDRVAGLSGRINAATCEWLGLVAEADLRGAWNGFASCVAWLSWQCGLGPGTASDHLRVARALVDMPLVRERFSAGALSFSQVRALTRARGILDEHTLLDLAEHATGAQLERLIRGLRGATSAQEEEDVEARQHANWHLDDDGSLILRARLTGEAAATMLAALEAHAAESRAQTVAAVAGAALAVAAESRAHAPSAAASPLGSTVTLVADVDALQQAVSLFGESSAEDSVVRWEPTGVPASTRTLATLLCDRQVNMLARLRDGSMLDLGRSRRRPTAQIARTVLRRHDHRCAVPACGARRHLHLHHVLHWARGGATSAANLVPLCGRHHRQLHADELTISPTQTAGRWQFRGRFGELLTELADFADDGAPGLGIDSALAPADQAARRITVTSGRADPLPLGYAVSVLLDRAG